ncbi:MAG: hypothetical protein ABW252_23060 [Polyangiales bacterium]
MRVDLSKLTSEGLALEWQGAHGEQRVTLRGASELRGTYVSQASGWQLSNTTAARVMVDTLALHFGAVEVALDAGGTLDDVVASLDKHDHLELDVAARTLETLQLGVTTKSLHVTGRIEARNVRLKLRAGGGELTVEHGVLRDLVIRNGDLELDAEALVLEQLSVQWGGGLRVTIGSASSAELVAKHAVAVARVFECHVTQLEVAGGAVRASMTQIERTELECLVPRRKSGASDERTAKPPAKGPPLFDYALLDGLAGYLHVDVEVDMAVPIIGRRRATHKLRVPIADGAINFRELEDDLASLEDSLIDFSVREGALVLERGLPLISTRGRGKPLLVWPLSPRDLALANQRRVRLAVLPGVQTVSEGGEPKDRDKPSKLQLRTMSFANVDASLSLDVPPQPEDAVLRALSLARLRVSGAVHHEAGAADPAGQLRAEIEGLDATVATLPVGTSHASAALSLRAVRNVEVDFEDFVPTQVRGLLEGLTLRGLALTQG